MQSVVEQVIDIIRENFPNGIRNDYIDTNKILKLYSSTHDNGNLSREFVTSVIHVNGIELRGRFYFLTDDDAKILIRRFGEILERQKIIYYSVFYQKYAEIFSRMQIASPNILKKILQSTDSQHHFFENFCLANKTVRLEKEIEKIFFDEDKLLSLDELQERLPFVPPEKILHVVSDSKKYVMTSDDKYFSTAKMQFDTEEISAAKEKILLAVGNKGYADSTDYDLSSTFALNSEIAPQSLLGVIHEKFFSDAIFRNKGKFFGRTNLTSNEKMLATTDCDVMRLLTQNDEIDLATLLTAGDMMTILSSALKIMIRVSEKLFVKSSLIKFDIDEVDNSLTPFVQKKIIPLRAVNSFSGFPPVEGYSWNLFLLESFLRRYSRQYRFMTQSVGNANVGAIYPRSMHFKNYDEVQAAAVVDSKIPLESVAVKNFLLEQGYGCKRSEQRIEQIIFKAQMLKSEAEM